MKSVLFRLFVVLALLALAFSAWGAAPARAATIIRVTQGAAAAWPCGGDWVSACPLQTALANALSGDEIWVAEGLYTPSLSDPAISLALPPGAAVYGGFDGALDDERTDRDPAAHLTILSGDVDGDDVNLDGNHIAETTADILGVNSVHVVLGADGATLDGFTITAGNAVMSGGGGMQLDHASPTISNVIFSGNGADFGGGLNGSESWSTLSNVIFTGNMAGDFPDGKLGGGGGAYFQGGDPTLTNVTFQNNAAALGGGLIIEYAWIIDYIELTAVTFSANSAEYGGGFVSYGSNTKLTNVTFNGNSAVYDGGGMRTGAYVPEPPILTNVTFSGNSAGEYGGGISGSDVVIGNSLFWGNTAPSDAQISGTVELHNSVVQDGYPGTNIITADPLLGTLGDYGGFTQTIPLTTGSSAIDTGNLAECPATDQRGATRPQGSGCDIGAYEFVPEIITFALTVEKVGGGMVFSAPAGIECGPTCSSSFESSTVVTLTAVPDASSVFEGWSGACSGNTDTCTVTMDAAKSVTASFVTLAPCQFTSYPPVWKNNTKTITWNIANTAAGTNVELNRIFVVFNGEHLLQVSVDGNVLWSGDMMGTGLSILGYGSMLSPGMHSLVFSFQKPNSIVGKSFDATLYFQPANCAPLEMGSWVVR